MDEIIRVVESAKLQKGEGEGTSASGNDGFAAKDMTFQVIQEVCRLRGVYSVPACNTILYLHQQKFQNICGLEKYTACKVLHLENNCLSSVDGIQCLRNLRVLYLQSNAISRLDGLETCASLDTLNISGNPIRHLSGLPPNLRTLHASRIGLSGAGNVRRLVESCPLLQVIDLSHNALQGDEVLSTLGQLSAARVLYLQQNKVTRLPNYRRRLILSMPELCYLDDRPVEDIERAGTEAWGAGGVVAERAARTEFRAAKRYQERRNVAAFAMERARRRALRESLVTSEEALVLSLQSEASLQEHVVATAEAVDALATQSVSQGCDARGAECAVCSDRLSVGDDATLLPCQHMFHSKCIHPWLLSFSNSCPLCRQAIGGDSRIIGGRSGSALRTQPPQSAVQSSAEGRRTSAPVSRQGRRSGHCVAPPWTVSPGSMHAADGAAMGRDPVACERSEEAVGSGSATPAGATDEAALEMAASDRDPRQRRIRQRINEMYRRSVGSRSREAESQLAAWRLLKHERKAAAADAPSARPSGSSPPLQHPTGSGACASQEVPNGIRIFKQATESVEGTPPLHSPLPVAEAGSTVEMEKSCEHSRWECPDTEPLGPPQATCANDRPGWKYPRQAWVEAERACEDGGGQEVLSVRVALTVSNEDGQVRLSLQIERMLQFFSFHRKASHGGDSYPDCGADDEELDHDAESGSDEGCPDEGELWDEEGVGSGGGEQAGGEVAEPIRLALPAGRVEDNGGGDLWALSGVVTVGAMPYM